MIKFHIDDNELKFAIDLEQSSKIVIPDGVTTIGKGALSGNHYVEEIIIPPSVTLIKPRAFANCTKLKSIIIPPSVEEVGEEAFEGCESLESISVVFTTLFHNNCFSKCRNLKKLIVPDDEARLFYFKAENIFAIAQYKATIPGGEIKIYTGRFAPINFPVKDPDPHAALYYFAVLNYEGREYVWYSRDLEMAIEGVNYAAREKTIKEHFKEPVTLDTIISPADFGLMTGICSDGIEQWITSLGKDWSWRAPVREILEGLARDIPGAYRRFAYVLRHQNEDLDLHNLDNGLTVEEGFRPTGVRK